MLTKLIKSNLRNDFSHMLTFFLILIISTFMLHSGSMLVMGYSRLFQEKKVEFDSADLVVIAEGLRADVTEEELEALEGENSYVDDLKNKYSKSYNSEMETYLNSLPEIDRYEKIKPINENMSYKKDSYDEDNKDIFDQSSFVLSFMPYGEWTEVEKPQFVEMSQEEYENPLYLSESINLNYFNFKLGQEVDCEIGDREYTFHVAGFYDSISEWKVAYIGRSDYNRLAQNEEGILTEKTNYYIKLSKGTDLTEFKVALADGMKDRGIVATMDDVDTRITQMSYMQNVVAAILIAFAIIIALVSMVVIYFRISNSIEQSVQGIGALKALGYTTGQMRTSMVLEYFLTASGGFVIGILISYLSMPKFEKIMRIFCGVKWDISFDIRPLLITFLIILGTIALVAFWSTRRIKGLDPAIALRFGLESHSFRKNYFPLERTGGGLNLVLALKSIMQGTKQNVMLVTLMTAIGFVVSFAVVMGYNTVTKPMNLYRTVNSTAYDVLFVFNKEVDLSEIREYPGVKDCYYMGEEEAVVEGHSGILKFVSDYQEVGFFNIYEGRSPIYDNEVALSGLLAESIGVKPGDEVRVHVGDHEGDLLVVGLVQGASGDQEIFMTTEGAGHFEQEENKNTIYVDMDGNENEAGEKLISDVKKDFGDAVMETANVAKVLEGGENIVIQVCGLLVAFIVGITVMIIVLCMALLLKTVIIRKQREIGIKKAIGFSSQQIRRTLVLSIMPQVMVGVVTGAVTGTLLSNRFFTMMLRSMGIIQANLEVKGWMGVFAVIFITILTAIITWILSGRIKKVSAYTLITE